MSEYTLFISHSSRDKPLVHQLCANLIADGFNVWLDDLSALPGDSLREKILEGVDASDFVLAVLSERAMQSEWVMEELKAATTREKEERRKIIIPLVIGEVNPVPVIGDRIYIRFDQGIYGALSDLLSALHEYGVERNPSNFIPLLFDAGSELDRALFQKRLLSINNPETKPRVWDVRDNLYSSLRKALLEKAEESSEARDSWREIDKLEKALQAGVMQLIERFRRPSRFIKRYAN